MPSRQLAHALTKALSPRPDGSGRRVVLLGVGSTIRGDDAAGVRIAEGLESRHLPDLTAVSGGSAPENLTAEIRRLSPTHLIIADSAEMGEAPGAVRLLHPDQIAGMSFGTHALPLSVLAGYLEKEMGCRVLIIGVQPRWLDFDAGLSTEVARAVDEVVDALAACLGPAPEAGP